MARSLFFFPWVSLYTFAASPFLLVRCPPSPLILLCFSQQYRIYSTWTTLFIPRSDYEKGGRRVELGEFDDRIKGEGPRTAWAQRKYRNPKIKR